MHVKPINAVGFTADGRRVVTVGKDLTVQIWDVKTGERLEILRLPGYGQEERLLRQIWETAAVSPDGKYVAIGGGNREIGEGSGKENNASLIIVDIQQRKVVGVHKSRGHISALALHPMAKD